MLFMIYEYMGQIELDYLKMSYKLNKLSNGFHREGPIVFV